MKKEHILTAAAAAVSFGVAGEAVAAPVIYDLTFTQIQGTSTGTGFFTIDDSLLVPDAEINDVADIDDFGATFTNVPGLGTVSFDYNDLASVELKVDGGPDDITIEFSTDFETPHLNGEAPGTSELKLAPLTEPLYYSTSIERRTETVAVPEPGTLALLAIGAAGLPLLRRRRAQRAV